MSDATILYAGVFCFAFMLLGMVLTVLEFRKMSAGENTKVPKQKLAYKM